MGEQLTAQILISNLHLITLRSRIILFRYVGFPSILSNIKYKSHTFLLYIILFYGVYILESFHIFDYKKHLRRKPTSYAREINKSSVKASPSPLTSTRKSCPHGTAPIQRTTKDDLNYSNTYTKDSKYWNILLPFSLFNQNQSFKDNSNLIKTNTYIHMNIKNSKNKNNNLQKPLPNTVTIYLFIFKLCILQFFFLLCFIKLFLIDQNISNIC